MPFTPFHFGPALLVKGAMPRRFSWIAFVTTTVVIDCETLYNIANHRYPVHRGLHTFLGASLAGLATSASLLVLRRWLPDVRKFGSLVRSDTSSQALWMGGVTGGASHPLLDGIMHRDVHPFLPWSASNPFLGTIDLGILHLGCIVAGVIGGLLVAIWTNRARTPAD